MIELSRGAKAWVITTSASLAIHTIMGQILFSVDLLQALQTRSQGSLAALTFLLVTRVILYFIIPAWGLYLLGRMLVERQLENRSKTSNASLSNESKSDPSKDVEQP